MENKTLLFRIDEAGERNHILLFPFGTEFCIYDHYTRRDMALRAARDYAKKYDYEEVKEINGDYRSLV